MGEIKGNFEGESFLKGFSLKEKGLVGPKIWRQEKNEKYKRSLFQKKRPFFLEIFSLMKTFLNGLIMENSKGFFCEKGEVGKF